MEEKGKRRFERQFQDALQSLEAQLNVGYSMENAIKEVQRDLQIMYDRHTLIVREFTYMVRQLNLNITAEAAWKDFAARVALPEVDTFVTVFSLAKRSGGDSILIIKNARLVTANIKKNICLRSLSHFLKSDFFLKYIHAQAPRKKYIPIQNHISIPRFPQSCIQVSRQQCKLQDKYS